MGTDDQAKRQRGIGPGPSSRHVAENVKHLRKSRGLELKELSARLKTLNRPMSISSINRIENGERRVDTDDLFALAMALDSDPSSLIQPNPPTEKPTAVPELLVWEEVKEWLGGRISLSTGDLFLYWERVEADALEQTRILAKKIEASEGAVRRIFEDRLGVQQQRLHTARDRCALFDSIGLDMNQFSTAKRLFDASE